MASVTLQTFCTKHVVEHRQVLNQQLDAIMLNHDTLRQTAFETKSVHQSLITYIDQWEQRSSIPVILLLIFRVYCH